MTRKGIESELRKKIWVVLRVTEVSKSDLKAAVPDIIFQLLPENTRNLSIPNLAETRERH